MSRAPRHAVGTALFGAALIVLSACATSPKPSDAPLASRVKLTMLQSNTELATRAPVEMKAAEEAVKAAEVKRKDDRYARHLVLLADQQVEIARARAQGRHYEDQRAVLGKQRERARLEARTLEVDRARSAGQVARADAAAARADAAIARDQVAAAQTVQADLQRQIAELNARETDRGLVVTLGDLLFATGKSDLTGGAAPNLDRLASFLGEYGDRTVLIEGHTDSVGSESMNQSLSLRRADSVRSYLVSRGVASQRLTTAGLGQGSPVASNDTATGRQQNRRVEVIISNATALLGAD
jgi:outer membrane protein OmpA-like peptidoglycan-associated protein